MAVIARSASSLASDPYRAGIELGTALAPVKPELVLLFAAVAHARNPELLEGLYDALGNPDVIVAGNSGDGYFVPGEVSNLGVAALGISTEGAVTFHLASAGGVGTQPEAAVRHCLAQLAPRLKAKPALYFMFSDFRTDASRIETVVRDEVDVPVIGGLAADDNQMVQCFVFANREIQTHGVVMVAADGPLHFDIAIGNSLTPVGRAGQVERASGTNVMQIDGLEAMGFIERETGKQVLQTDRGVLALTVTDSEREGEKILRTIVPDFSVESGSLGLYGGIQAGKQVRVCLAEPEQLVSEVYRIAAEARSHAFEPAAAFVVSCNGRKWLLGEQIRHETLALSQTFGAQLPLVGFASFGEIGPLKRADGSYTRNLFHNMTYVLLLVGQPPAP
ncbi:FIST signal transduction protein [Ideonella sp. BN130291]|uniref:FIST signal transduction protein n=1 Tax=Ideonella sp. BN130291 TaxID=3112940 RepID=UPI002E2707D7|nr:FIST N-terminal domain-containing protein [Ideonella sp. BN130291]